MVRKIIQWVPIDGTRWRNEFVNGHENHGVGVHYGIAPGGVIVGAPSRESTHLFVGEDACGCQKLASQKSAEIRSHQDALQTPPLNFN